MADSVIENLITKLSFDADQEQLDKFDDFLKSSVKGLATLVAGATAAATAIFVFTKSIAESNDELGKFAQRVGIDIQALQELGYVAELNGGSIDSMNSSLANLSRSASEAARGMGSGVEAFGMLGISVTDATGRLKQADDLLFDVADGIARLGSQAERLEFAQKLGIGGDLLLAIQQGSAAIREQRKEARELGFVIDQDAADAAANFNDEMLRVMKIVSGVSSAIATRLMKQLQPMIKQFVTWYKVNKNIIKQNITSFLDMLTRGIRAVYRIGQRVVSVINALVNSMGGWKNSIIAVTGLLVAMNASALLMPILAIAAGAGILLILEDIKVFAEGGDSALGQLEKRFPVLGDLIRGVLHLLGMARDGWVLLLTEGGTAFEGLTMMISDFIHRFPVIGQMIEGLVVAFNLLENGVIMGLKAMGLAADGWLLILKGWGKVFDFLAVRGPAALNIVKVAWGNLVTSIKDGVGVILGLFSSLWEALITGGAEAVAKVAGIISDLRAEFSLLDGAIKAVSGVFSLIGEGWSKVFDEGAAAIERLISMLDDFGGKAKDLLLTPIDKAVTLLNKIPGVNLGENDTQGVDDVKVNRQVEDITEPVVGAISRSAAFIGPVIGSAARVVNESRVSQQTTRNDVYNIDRSKSNINKNQSTVGPTTNSVTISINGGDESRVKTVVFETLSELFSGAETNLASQVEQ